MYYAASPFDAEFRTPSSRYNGTASRSTQNPPTIARDRRRDHVSRGQIAQTVRRRIKRGVPELSKKIIIIVKLKILYPKTVDESVEPCLLFSLFVYAKQAIDYGTRN